MRSIRTIMRWLVEDGAECRALTTQVFEGAGALSVEEGFALQHVSAARTPGRPADLLKNKPPTRTTWRYEVDGVEALMVKSLTPKGKTPLEVDANEFARHAHTMLSAFQPEVLLTTGGHRALHHTMRLAQRYRARVIYTLRNYGHEDRFRFQHADRVFTVSEHMARHYAETAGIRATAILPPIDWDEVLVDEGSARRDAVVFVNPVPRKGSTLVARLAQMLAERRPDIHLAVVASQGSADGFRELAGGAPVEFLEVTRRPGDFLGRAKILLAPSILEPAGRIAAEAMINGIAVIGADSGGLPEVMAGCGILLPLPDSVLRLHRKDVAELELPTEAEAQPWFEAVVKLWDNGPAREEIGLMAKEVAELRYSPAVSRKVHLDTLREVKGK